MRNTLKKAAASIVAFVSLSVSMIGISANAAPTNKYDFTLSRYPGAPGGAATDYADWYFTTTDHTIEFVIKSISRSSGSSYSSINLYAELNGNTVINTNTATTGNVNTSCVPGQDGFASVTMVNYYSGTHIIKGEFWF